MSSLEEIHNHSTHALQLLQQGRSEELSEFLNGLHPVELSALVHAVEDTDQAELIKHVTGLDQVAALIAYGSDSAREQTLSMLDESRVAAVIRRLEVDDAADVLATLPRRRQVGILRRVSADQARDIRRLLAYDKETAGGIMTTTFVTLSPDATVDEALLTIRHRLRGGDLDQNVEIKYVYIVNERDELVGVQSLREMLAAEPGTRISDLMETDLILAR
ncbi:MAG: magnesium transporter, partial [Bdellovibrionales bacterium]|nr:magnesium transporter [Bdellovibrionales bacterium]